MKKTTIISVFLFLLLGLAGCGHLETTDKSTLSELENSISINSDGSVKNIIVEDFDKDYYSIDGLTQMIENSILEFKAGEIKLDDISKIEDSSLIKVTMTYDSAKCYEDFNEKLMFFGTVEEAFNEGLLKGYDLYSVNDKLSLRGEITLFNLEQFKEYHIIIMEENMNLYTFGEILAVDKSGNLNSKKSLSFEESGTNHIVIFK